MMSTALSLLLSISALTVRPLPEGTQLHVRLTGAVGSYGSGLGSPVSAVLIAPVAVNGETVLQAGSTISGRVKAVTRVGFGVHHETAGLDLEFSRLTPLDSDTIPISAQVADVDNSRERVTPSGRIQGVRVTGSMTNRVGGYIRTALQWEVHAEIAEWAIKSLLIQLPEPEIYYPAGVELTLTLTRPLLLDASLNSEHRELTNGERQELARVVAAMPYRTQAPVSGRSSDFTNLLLIGSREQIAAAFFGAGWTQATPTSLRYRINWLRAAGELRGDVAAPMSPLYLDGVEADMSWQKGLNDVSKRHHIRIWRAAGMWRERELWIGAATRDIDFTYLRRGGNLTHRIEENIDRERNKVAYDLAFTSCATLLDWTDRENIPRFAHNATGDSIATDGRMAVVELNDCPAPRLSTETVDLTAVPEHGNKMHRFARREVLSARNELIRTNTYWRSYEGGRWVVDYVRRHRRQTPDVELSSKPPASGLTRSALLSTPRLY